MDALEEKKKALVAMNRAEHTTHQVENALRRTTLQCVQQQQQLQQQQQHVQSPRMTPMMMPQAPHRLSERIVPESVLRRPRSSPGTPLHKADSDIMMQQQASLAELKL